MSEWAMVRDIKEFVKASPAAPILSGFRTWLSAPYDQLEIFNDYRSTLVDSHFIRESNLITDPIKRVLIASMTTDIYPIKMEAMLATGLRLEGWSPTVLTSRLHTWAKSYFEAFGIEDFIYWEEFSLSHIERRKCVEDAAEFLTQDLSFQAAKGWTYLGAWIGPQILSAISRSNHQGAPDLSDPIIRSELERLLPRTLENVIQSRKLIDTFKPVLTLINEANGPIMGPIIDTAVQKGSSVAQYVQPSRDDALVLKRLTPETRRIHPNSVSRATLEKLMARPWGQGEERALTEELDNRYNGKWFLQNRNQQYTTQESQKKICRKLDLDPNKKTAIIFSHVLWDANLFYGDDLFEDYGHWFVETVRAATRNPNLNWVVKMHPANAWKRARDNAKGEPAETKLIREKIGLLPDNVKLLQPESEISTMALFRICDFGITVRGTTGIELPCFGKSILTAGTGRYSDLGFTIDSRSRVEYLNRLSELHTYPAMTPEQTLLAKRHAHAVFRIRPWSMKSFRSVFNYPKVGRHPLDQNLKFECNTIEAIQKNQDLKKWAVWATDLKNIDYIDIFPV